MSQGEAPSGDETQAFNETIQNLLAFMPDASVVIRGDGTISALNSALLDLFGYRSEDELVGQPIEVLVPERFRELHRTQRQVYQAAPQARPMGAGLVLSGRRIDGTEFPIDVSLAPIISGRRRLVIAAIRDTTERRVNEVLIGKELKHLAAEVGGLKAQVTIAGDVNAKIEGVGRAAEKSKSRLQWIAGLVVVALLCTAGNVGLTAWWVNRQARQQCESLNASNASVSAFALKLIPVGAAPGPDATPEQVASYQGGLAFRQAAVDLGVPKDC